MACWHLTLLLIGLMTSVQTLHFDWLNEPRGMISRSCMFGFGVSGLVSEYDRSKKDRQWRLLCSSMGQSTGHTCAWTYDYVPAWGVNLNFRCPQEQGYISGLYSGYTEYDVMLNDRQWRIECCTSPGVTLTSCETTPWSNMYRERLEFTLPPGKAITGLVSQFSRRRRDRRWRFVVCDRN